MRRFFVLRYNQFMRPPVLIGILFILLSFLLLLTTLIDASDEQVVVPFTTSSGLSGYLTYSLPQKIYAGDKGEIGILFKLDDASQTTFGNLILHVEAGFEEITPAPLVTAGFKQDAAINLKWNFRTAKAAQYPGTLWIWIDAGNGRELLLAKDFLVASGFYLGTRIANFRIAYGIAAGLSSAWLLFVICRGISPRKARSLQ